MEEKNSYTKAFQQSWMHKDQYQSHVSVADMTAKPGGDDHNEEGARLTVSPLAQATNNEQHPNLYCTH